MLFPFDFSDAGIFAPLTLSAVSIPSNLTVTSIVDLILPFVAGLFFGLAIKKGIMAFVFAIIGFLIASYVGLTFIPKISISYEIHKWTLFLSSYISTVKFGSLTLSLTVILFLVGLAIGLWKG
ncbi:MAG: hypothetical protein M0Z77_04485 [Thermoplasmatales archaeon]|nr:hypothetical protein [Thermoplasmatales archaeon]